MASHGSNDMFNLPGANAMGDTLEFVKNLWGSMKIPGMIPGMSMPSLSPDDIDKQISDLKAVESWLQINMNMLRSSIQALEVQSATLSALRSMGGSFAKAASASAPAEDQPSFESPFAKATTSESHAPTGAMPEAAAMAAQFANPAVWWNAVQEQFSNAVNQAMTPVVSPAKKAAKKTVKKAAVKKTVAAKTARKRSSKG